MSMSDVYEEVGPRMYAVRQYDTQLVVATWFRGRPGCNQCAKAEHGSIPCDWMLKRWQQSQTSAVKP